MTATTALYSESLVSLEANASPKDFFELLKPRVMTLVVFTGFTGLMLAPVNIHPFLAFVAVLCIAVGAGASGAINMWYERDIDAIMSRTKNRPLPQNRIEPSDALVFGLVLTFLSVGLMAIAVNLVAAGILAFASFFYVVVYTIWLKPRTPQNIVIGGAAGAFPPMIGWACATGTVSIESIILFAIIFMWTPPHFWALALYKNTDYKKAGIPMLPVVAGERVTKLHILLYTLVLTPVVLAPYFLHFAGSVYLTGALALQTWFIVSAFKVWGTKDLKPAKAMFLYSIFYLFAIFALLILDKVF